MNNKQFKNNTHETTKNTLGHITVKLLKTNVEKKIFKLVRSMKTLSTKESIQTFAVKDLTKL